MGLSPAMMSDRTLWLSRSDRLSHQTVRILARFNRLAAAASLAVDATMALLDRVVDLAYGRGRYGTDAERLTLLFERYGAQIKHG